MFVVRIEGWREQALAEGEYPIWSPDGRWIAFRRSQPDSVSIFTIHPDGSGLLELGRYSSCAYSRWSPDGRWLEVLHPCPTFRFTVPPDAEVVDLRRKLKWSLGTGYAVFDPKRPRIVFERVRPKQDLWVMNLDGSNASLLGDTGEFYSWSPRGRQFLLEEDDRIELVTDGERIRTRDFAAGEWPTWSPDGKRIAYLQRQRVPCGTLLMIKDVRGGRARPLAHC